MERLRFMRGLVDTDDLPLNVSRELLQNDRTVEKIKSAVQGCGPHLFDRDSQCPRKSLSRFFNWRDALVVVRPETMIRWHRAGWKLLWRLKSRPGRSPIPRQIQDLIRRMANEDPAWGEQRTANEFLVKLGIRLSRRMDAVRVNPILGGLHHEYFLAPAYM